MSSCLLFPPRLSIFNKQLKKMPDTFSIDHLIQSRRSKRGYLARPVAPETIKEILQVARFAPSSSNSQPWRCIVLTGRTLGRVTDSAVQRYRSAPESLAPEYPFFPAELHEPYAQRINSFRDQLGEAQGCPRTEKAVRMLNIERQYRFFDAPVGLIFTMDRKLERANFICYGCFLQNIMLAAKARRLDTCPQQIWSLQHWVLRQELNIPADDMVVAGMALGWADPDLLENHLETPRTELDEMATFYD